MGGRVRVNHRSGRSQVVAYCPDQLLWGDPKESPARRVEANRGLVALRGPTVLYQFHPEWAPVWYGVEGKAVR